MRPSFKPDGLKKTKASEHAIRFLFGGAVTVITGLIAHRWGPAIGGLFLAFPAILPASLTLVKKHDGRAKAADDARGAQLGAIGLGAFGATVWLLSPLVKPFFLLTAGMVVWAAVGVSAWALVFGRDAGSPEK